MDNIDNRITGLFAKGIFVKRVRKIIQAYKRRIEILKETITFLSGEDIVSLRKENTQLKGYYEGECKRNKKLKLVNESQQEEIYRLKNIIEIRK